MPLAIPGGDALVAAICARHGIAHETIRASPYGGNALFFVDERFVVKVFAPLRGQAEREIAALRFASGKTSIETPELIASGGIDGWSYVVMTQLHGTRALDVWRTMPHANRLALATRLGAVMRELHAHPAPPAHRDWWTFIDAQAAESVERQRACGANPEWLESLPAFLARRRAILPATFRPVFLHGDIHAGNLLLAQRDGAWELTGLFDFGDSFTGFAEYELVAPGLLMVQGDRELQRAMLLAYGFDESQLTLALRARLMMMTVLYECADLRKYALRLREHAVELTLAELEAGIWTFV